MAYTYVRSNSLSCRIDHFVVTATLGQKVLECSIIDNLLFSDHVPLNIKWHLNVNQMLKRNYCHMQAWIKPVVNELINTGVTFNVNFPRYYVKKGALHYKNAICKNMLMNDLDYRLIY